MVVAVYEEGVLIAGLPDNRRLLAGQEKDIRAVVTAVRVLVGHGQGGIRVQRKPAARIDANFRLIDGIAPQCDRITFQKALTGIEIV